MKIRKVVIGVVLVIIGLPVALVLIAAAAIYVLDRSKRHHRFLGTGAAVPALCPTELRPHEADAARHQHARRRAMAGPANEPESLESAGR